MFSLPDEPQCQEVSCNSRKRRRTGQTENMSSSNFDNADAKPEFNLGDARTAITGLSLISVILGDFMVIMNCTPDVIIADEPYLSLMILIEIKSGTYIRRIWNRTVARGKTIAIEQLLELCKEHFFQGKPCIGCPQYRKEEGQDFVISQTPIPRKISRYCQEVLGSDAKDEVNACPECLKFSGSEEQTLMDVVTKCKVEVKSEIEEWQDVNRVENKLTFSINEEMISETITPAYCVSEKSRKLTYTKLIAESINNSEKKMLPLSGIYAYINKHHPHFKIEEKRRQNAIRHNLSQNNKFKKVPRKMGSCLWMINDGQHDNKEAENADYLWIVENNEGSKAAGNSKDLSVIEKDEDVKVADRTRDSMVVNQEKSLGSIKKMKCGLCEHEFANNHLLIRHAKDIHGLGLFNCGACMFKGQFVSDIIQHMEQQHEQMSSQEINCPTCKVNVEIFSITEHYKECIKIDVKVPVKCQWCEKVLASSASLSCHAKNVHGRGKFVCPHCKFIAHFAEDLINHIEERGGHNQNIDISCPCCNNSYPPKEIVHHYKVCLKVHKSKQNNVRPIMCKTCKKVFKGGTCYKSHMKTHMRSEGIDESEAKVKLYHYCDKCGKRFNTKSLLIGHIRSVHDKIDYTCPECPMTCKTQDQLYNHRKLAHSTDERFNCKHCGKRFGQLCLARSHERSHEDPQLQCRFCSKLLKSERSLVAHERVHTGEKPFMCKICSTDFTSKGSLRQHEQYVHKVIGPKGGGSWCLKQKKKDESEPGVA